ncbi:MAG: hypothetical protein JNM64_17470, partial [Chloroflexia bacterium]|nr:hypothetical protein [Chloroflexia bacterium]
MKCTRKGAKVTEATWVQASGFEDIIYEKSSDGIARVVINRPHVRNAFRPQTVQEMIAAFVDAR